MATRWTDEMLDRLADKVEANADSIAELRENQLAILQGFVQEHEENRQLRLQYQQDREQYQQDREQYQLDREQYLEWRKETDQRFNILLQEIRASNRRIDNLDS